jgi:hypothetical protein
MRSKLHARAGDRAVEVARSRGMSAAYRGEPYASNPFLRGTAECLAWSQAHNGARANAILRREGR